MRTIPGIGNKLAEIKLAMEKGDATELELAKESYRTDLAKLENDMLKKHYGTVSSELNKAYTELQTAKDKMNVFEHKTDVEVAKTTGRFDVKQARVEARQERKTKIALQDDAQAHEINIWDHKLNRGLQALEDLGVPTHNATDIVRAATGTDPQDADVILYESTMGMPEKERQMARKIIRDIKGTGGSSTTGGAGKPLKPTQTQSDEIAFNAFEPLRSIPVLTTDKNKKFLFFGKDDQVEGRIPDDADFKRVGREMVVAARKAGRQGLHPSLLLKSIDTEIIKARELLEEYNDVLVGGGIEFEKTPEEEYPDDLDDQDIMRQNIMELTKAKQTIDFFDSEAGQQYLKWVDESLTESLRQDKLVYVNPPAFNLSRRSQEDTSTERSQEDTSMGRFREIEAEMRRGRTSDTTPTTTTPEGQDTLERIRQSRTPPNPELENKRIHKQIKNMSDAIEAQGWRTGNVLEYVGPKELKIKYLGHYIQPGMRFKIVGVANKEKDGYPYDGVLVKFQKVPFNLKSIITFEPTDIFVKLSIPPSVWKHFVVRQ